MPMVLLPMWLLLLLLFLLSQKVLPLPLFIRGDTILLSSCLFMLENSTSLLLLGILLLLVPLWMEELTDLLPLFTGLLFLLLLPLPFYLLEQILLLLLSLLYKPLTKILTCLLLLVKVLLEQ